MTKRYYAYCDGACTKLGIGGAGGFIYTGGKVKLAFSLDQNNTTNNQMEMSGVIMSILGFLEVAEEGDILEVITDSQYCQKGIMEWSKNWIKRGWKTSSGEPVLNKEIWVLMLDLIKTVRELGYGFKIKWVKGHVGNSGNEVSDFLASRLNPDRSGEAVIDDIEKNIRHNYTNSQDLTNYRPEIYSAIQVGFGDDDIITMLETVIESSNEIFC